MTKELGNGAFGGFWSSPWPACLLCLPVVMAIVVPSFEVLDMPVAS